MFKLGCNYKEGCICTNPGLVEDGNQEMIYLHVYELKSVVGTHFVQ